ncbi:O-antigen translocase [Escherichia coli]|uniref:O-antigen translocase n=2 Tax=Escherichia coli TaxID=562 RepID=UPI000CF19B97|nr:O-antigen translocase [Escherichia coli]EEV9321794.1 O-antigen translocase [Escherichia coli]EEW5975203.1 O-antigen translocase [Escherichia coli]EFJ2085538.1 O-antigen translocase [Escherichia coli]EGI3097930.1 O-antigen translocase [Escherichia coli]EGI3154017.1 O-antigen translocase [Escherichia coli]
MKRLLSVTSFTALLTLSRMLAGFLVAKVVAIYTGPAGLAMLGQLQNVIVSLNGLVSAPVGNGVVRYTAQYEKDGYRACSPWWRAALLWGGGLFVIFGALGIILSNKISQWLFHSLYYNYIIILALCMMPLSIIGTFVVSVINGQQRYRKYVILGMCSVLFSSTLMIYFSVNYKLDGALIAAVLQTGAIGLIYFIAALKEKWFSYVYLIGSIDKDKFWEIGKYLIMAIASALSMPVAIIFIRNQLIDVLGWSAAGQWQAVWKISESYLSVITIAMSVYYLPLLSKIDCIQELKREVNRNAIVIVPIVFLLSVAVYLFRDSIITILFTSEFREARDLFAIQLIGNVIKVTSWLYAFPIISRGMAKTFILTEIVFSMLFVIFSVFFIRLYGLNGANIAYCINYTIYFFIVYFLLYYSKKVNV